MQTNASGVRTNVVWSSIHDCIDRLNRSAIFMAPSRSTKLPARIDGLDNATSWTDTLERAYVHLFLAGNEFPEVAG